MCRKKHSIYRVCYYLWFQVSTGSLGTYPLQTRGDYCIISPGILITSQLFDEMLVLVSSLSQNNFLSIMTINTGYVCSFGKSTIQVNSVKKILIEPHSLTSQWPAGQNNLIQILPEKKSQTISFMVQTSQQKHDLKNNPQMFNNEYFYDMTFICCCTFQLD